VEYLIGDCLGVLKTYPDDHFDSCVTDPPYGLEFMGKEWDKLGLWTKRDKATADPTGKSSSPFVAAAVEKYVGGKTAQEWHSIWAKEVFRVLKPGAYILSFGGTRTHHRMVCALEDVGFEIRDCLMWLYGSGFPKSLDVSKAIDKHFKAERKVIGEIETPWKTDNIGKGVSLQSSVQEDFTGHNEGGYRTTQVTEPATPEAEKWNGWGTALKPAYEPIVLARKPLSGTVAQNVLKHGTGGINVDGCRIRFASEEDKEGTGRLFQEWHTPPGDGVRHGKMKVLPGLHQNDVGRWPSNLLLDEESAKMLDEQSGESESKLGLRPRTDNNIFGTATGVGELCELPYNDKGGASRFFYIAKASRSEREKGLKGKPKSFLATMGDGIGIREHNDSEPNAHVANFHPTVKPLELMRYLVRLVTPKDGLCLDPFLGSGTTLLACRLEGFNGLGIEKESDYEPIIKERLAYIPPPLDSFGEVSA